MTAPSAGRPDARFCKKCGAAMNPGAIVCVSCGHNHSLGMNVRTAETAKKAGRLGASVGAAALVAVVVGAVWGGLAILTHREFGIAAWILGAAVGVAVRLASGGREGPNGGMVAAALTVAGICLGKIIFITWGAASLGVAEVKKDADLLDEIRMEWMFLEYPAWQKTQYEDMFRNGEMSQDLFDYVITRNQQLIQIAEQHAAAAREGDEEAIQAIATGNLLLMIESRVPEELQAESETVGELNNERLEDYMSSDAFIQERLEGLIGRTSYFERLKAAMSPIDLLFILLAIVSAFKIGSGMSTD